MTNSRRAFVAIALAVVPPLRAQPPAAKPKVVFVCEHGAAKSIMAAAEFGRMAKERGLEFTIVSRGTNPDADIAAAVRKGLQADGMDVGSAMPTKVAAKDLAGAARIVSFGPDLSELIAKDAKVLDWSPMPSPGQDYQKARDHLRKQLEGLLSELQAETKQK